MAERVLDAQRRQGSVATSDRYHHRPHSGADYRTSLDVRQARGGSTETAARTVNASGEQGTFVWRREPNVAVDVLQNAMVRP